MTDTETLRRRLEKHIADCAAYEGHVFDLMPDEQKIVLDALAAQDQPASPGLTEDDAKFLNQVADMISRSDGDPPNSEGIFALKLRAIAASLRTAERKPTSPDRCARCGFPRKEHQYNGNCYSVCGKFVAHGTAMEKP